MNIDYDKKARIMAILLSDYKSDYSKFTSLFRQVPISDYELVKPFIDYTRFYICFRGKRKGYGYSTLKSDAFAFDVYEYDNRKVYNNRTSKLYWQSVETMVKGESL
jgi:hypothetical protein